MAATRTVRRSHGAPTGSGRGEAYFDSFLGVTAMTTLLGKKRFEETIGGLIEKPAGKPALVPVTDKRQEININTAADDFADPIEK